MPDLEEMSDAQFDQLLAAYNLDNPAVLEEVAALVDEARVRDRISNVATVEISPRRALDLFTGRVAFDKEEGWRKL